MGGKLYYIILIIGSVIAHTHRHNRSHIFDVQRLANRPERISERVEFGHWECDLMMFRKEHGKVT
jgi:IS30 family transposase